jgi:hypothetical protein
MDEAIYVRAALDETPLSEWSDAEQRSHQLKPSGGRQDLRTLASASPGFAVWSIQDVLRAQAKRADFVGECALAILRGAAPMRLPGGRH